MDNRPNNPEDFLTPHFARTMIRFFTRKTGEALFDDDLAQDALLRAVRAWRQTDRIRYPRTFFGKIVMDTVRDHWRRRPKEVPLDAENRLTCRPNIEEAVDRQRLLRRLGGALSSLAERDRTIVERFYLQEVNIPAIGQEFNLSSSAIKMILLRSRRTLHRLLIKSV